MNFSIITCTYNPNEDIFKRLIKAVENLIIPENTNVEWIIVDNNSTKPVSESGYVPDLLKNRTFIKIIKEQKQGLTFARIAGIKASKYDWIIFFDDDNEPDKTYLTELNKLILKYPQVISFGAGNISVEYIGEIKSKWINKRKNIFQQSNIDNLILYNTYSPANPLPVGTGLICKKETLTHYILCVENGTFTATDRTGKSLISGGDTQIILSFLSNNLYVGLFPELKINHLISSEKTKFKKILKLIYWLNSSFLLVYNEVFTTNQIQLDYLENISVLKKIFSIFRINKFKLHYKDLLLKITEKLGEINARYVAGKRKAPIILKLWEIIIN